MPKQTELKIWKYMDLPRFVSLLATRSLYFASRSKFQDPWEGSLPQSHMMALSKMLQDSFVTPTLSLRAQFAAQSSEAAQNLDAVMESFKRDASTANKQATLRFGVSCWHKSDYESDAMWKLYSASGKGIAMESTIGQLQAALGHVKGLIIDSVRYADFDNDPIERGHKHYGLFLKRKCFEHEKELRATILLPQDQWQLPPAKRGLAVECDLGVLITRVHVSPLSEEYVFHAVQACVLAKRTR